MKLPDKDLLLNEIVPTYKGDKSSFQRQEIINLIEDYFGEHDAHIILAIALYFKRPQKFSWLYPHLKKALEEV